jgi:UDP-N-acetylmuramoyl-L-alanyl-D-glutamate--2,6-diaminopimelate ligase
MKNFCLIDLFKDFAHNPFRGDPKTVSVSDIVYDSRKAVPGTLFVALPPTSAGGLDGHDFALSAYGNGARAFLCSRVPDGISDKTDAAIVLTADTRHALALASAEYFSHPADRLKLVALTGTKGKTTISFMLRAVFEAAGKKIGLIGSNGVFYGDIWFKLPNTTPESYQLQSILNDMAEADVEYCVLEATSQGFYLGRTDGIRFALGLYTNIAHDHISAAEHPSFEHYFESKRKIFTQTNVCFVNRDADRFAEIVKDAPCEIRTFGFAEGAKGAESNTGFGNACGALDVRRQNPQAAQCPDYTAADIRLKMDSNLMTVRFDCRAPSWGAPFLLQIPGKFNASNALAAICVADFFGMPKESIQAGLASAIVKGRMELVDVPAPYTVLIDFAHNRLSMEGLMETARQYHPKRILCVFGLEGNRSHTRRFDSGEILGRDADFIILANASPRTDDPDRILEDIAVGIERGGGKGRYVIIPSRRDAIWHMLSLAKTGDLILLVGKGNVLYEEVNGVNIPFSERDVVEDFFAAKQVRDDRAVC